MKKVSFGTPVIFYIKENEYYRHARQSDWQRKKTDQQRFKDRVKAFGEILIPLLKNGKNFK